MGKRRGYVKKKEQEDRTRTGMYTTTATSKMKGVTDMNNKNERTELEGQHPRSVQQSYPARHEIGHGTK